jgi:hypothetical protein
MNKPGPWGTGPVVAAWAIGVGLSAIRAAAARVGGFSLLAVFVYVADEHPAAYASVRRRRSRERRNNRVIGGCLLVYSGRG